MSGLSSLNVGSQALSAAQRALDVTGQNVSNVNTEGYSRQRVQQTSRGASTNPAMWSRSDTSLGGVDVIGIERIRDGFLEARAHQEHATNAGLGALSATYTDLESTFGEPSPTGLQAQMASFWNSWQDVANSPGDAGPSGMMLEGAKTVASTLNRFATQLSQQWVAGRNEIDSTVAGVNSMTAEVARLNNAIRSATLNGSAPNELSDQRDVLVLRIAEATGAVATAGDDGVVNLALAGRALVSGIRSERLEAQGPTSYPSAAGTVSLTWAATGQPATVDDGTLAGQVTSLNVTIPGAMADIDAVATNLATTVNAQQAAGFTRAGNAGAAIFSGTTAATMTVVLTDPADIAPSSEMPPVFNGTNAIAMSAHASDLASPDAQYRDMMVRLGVQAESTQRRTETQQAVVNRIDAARDSVSGVSLDEEMTNLVAYQHAYSAAAKFISVIDSTMDSLINMTH
ncbi:MAG: flagellar hook-associated protein 1 [Actinomycetota bacterium]|nr:flagellar hook-associated protein 1 [Actinomycetota bacterium]